MKKHTKYSILISTLVLLLIGYFIADNLLFDGIQPKFINESNFQANYFSKKDVTNKTTVVLIGGEQWGDYWSEQFAKNDMVGVSIPYIGKEGLPKLPEEIDLEYFEKAIHWLRKQPEVNPNKIVVMGASRNAELALIIAATFPETVSGVIAYAPSAVSWSNTVLPYNSNELKPSWTYKSIDIPYIPMPKIQAPNSNKIEMLAYWERGLAKMDDIHKASIQVEKINGPILLFSGNDDNIWPSAKMADMIADRLKNHNFEYEFQNIKYENAGHLISSDPDNTSSVRIGKINIDGKDYEYEFGGTNEGDFKAKQDAKAKVIAYLNNL